MDEVSDTERRANFDLVVAALERERGGSEGKDPGLLSLGCEPAVLHEFVAKRAAEDLKADELLVLAQIVCFWDAAAMPWCLYTLAQGVAANSGSSGGDKGARNRDAVAAGARSGGKGGSVLGRDLASDESVSSGVAVTWMLLLQRALALRFVSCALVLRCGPARYALTKSQEDELLTAAKGVGASTAAHFALLSPYPAGKSVLCRKVSPPGSYRLQFVQPDTIYRMQCEALLWSFFLWLGPTKGLRKRKRASSGWSRQRCVAMLSTSSPRLRALGQPSSLSSALAPSRTTGKTALTAHTVLAKEGASRRWLLQEGMW
jgi:hypothetical protein